MATMLDTLPSVRQVYKQKLDEKILIIPFFKK